MTRADQNGQQAAFEQWAENISLPILKCRTSGHRFPDWDDPRRTAITRNPGSGAYVIRAACIRKCGVILSRYITPDGYLSRSNRITHDYSQAHPRDRDPDKSYKMPAAARTGHGYTKDQRAYLRRELILRLSEWITEE